MTAAREPVTAYVALGANLGDARATVRQALRDLAWLPDTRLLAQSSLWRSAPVDAAGPDFVNAVAALSTRLTAPALLAALRQLEDAAGRRRPYPHAPRTLDLDLLRYGDGRIDSPRLTLPHPRMAARAFVLRPLAEIAPHLVSADALLAVAEQAIRRLPLDDS
ncbi:MAG: 2-amino-4-hydroxy-6-hydroxymethyldihydropteridine diphosphokinase [Ottowia sp.]|uniref:2-amino-4-hydroxy-6- hydroxymethyldihydropteridine diphosphokinase n=1 Tax=Ottowia sp. TaxID=1898956 RepID=UPI0039E5D4CF